MPIGIIIRFLYGTIILLSCFLIISLAFNLSYKFEDSTTMIKIIPPMIGATISGVVALIIFYMNKHLDKVKTDKAEEKTKELIILELKENINILKNLKLIVNNEHFVKQLKIPESITRNGFLIEQSKLSTVTLDNLIDDLNKNDYITMNLAIKTIYKIKGSILLINDATITNEKNLESLKTNICSNIDTFLQIDFNDFNVEAEKKSFSFFTIPLFLSILFFILLQCILYIPTSQ